MVIAASASAGLLAACAPTTMSAMRDRPVRTLAGKVSATDANSIYGTRVTATDANGFSFHGQVKGDGRYVIKRVPVGTYTLIFVPACGDSWKVENIVVATDAPVVADTKDPNECITVGKLLIDDGTPDREAV
jgi:hypothetical protein